jgi:hypothetical protein
MRTFSAQALRDLLERALDANAPERERRIAVSTLRVHLSDALEGATEEVVPNESP